MNRPLSLTRDGLMHALGSIATELRRTPDAIDRAIVRLDDVVARRAAEHTAANLDDAIVDRMVRVPWRITRAVYGLSVPAMWPHEGKSAAAVLADCRVRIAAELGRAGHWTYEPSRLVALRQAERALERMTDPNKET